MLQLKNKKVTPLQEKETKPIYCDGIQNKAKCQIFCKKANDHENYAIYNIIRPESKKNLKLKHDFFSYIKCTAPSL